MGLRFPPSESVCTDVVQNQGGKRTSLAGFSLLAHPDLVFGPQAPLNSLFLGKPPQERSLGLDTRGTLTQTSMSGPWTGCQRPKCAITSSDRHHHSSQSPLYVMAVRFEVAPLINRCSFRDEDPHIAIPQGLAPELEPVLGQDWHSLITSSCFHWHVAELSTNM